jgi:hypothetical protein
MTTLSNTDKRRVENALLRAFKQGSWSIYNNPGDSGEPMDHGYTELRIEPLEDSSGGKPVVAVRVSGNSMASYQVASDANIFINGQPMGPIEDFEEDIFEGFNGVLLKLAIAAKTNSIGNAVDVLNQHLRKVMTHA